MTLLLLIIYEAFRIKGRQNGAIEVLKKESGQQLTNWRISQADSSGAISQIAARQTSPDRRLLKVENLISIYIGETICYLMSAEGRENADSNAICCTQADKICPRKVHERVGKRSGMKTRRQQPEAQLKEEARGDT